MDLTEFNEIRPYNDEELPQIFEELIADPAFQKVVAGVIPNVPFELLAQKMRACKTKREFQEAFCYGILWKIAQEHTDSLTLDHSRIPDHNIAYTYMSNHRDIILDSGFLSILLIDEGMDTVEIAIGDNLLIYPWIKKLVRVNKSFIVQRALTMRQMLESSARMSRYMHHTISQKKQSIWIAQREGRAKDSNDRTQDSVLKMLAMGGEGDVIDRLLEMNIAPLAISYEYDPCDFLKAQEFQLKRDVEGYKKTTQDDLINMKTGLFGYKGRVHFQVAPCLNDELLRMDRSLPKEGKIELTAACDGLLKIDAKALKEVNSFGQMMIATRHGNFAVKKGDKLAGTRIIPLVIEEEKMTKAKEAAMAATGNKPILDLLPFKHKKVGIVTTGNEVFYGRIKDTFTPVIEGKMAEFDTEIIDHVTWNDDDTKVTASILDMIKKGADIVVCTGGMSVDPDDKTPLAIKNTGADIVSYGAPVLPGAMFMLAYCEKEGRQIPVMGLPGCVMYAKRTIFDLVLPRIMCDEKLHEKDFRLLGQGGLCLSCPVCTFPNCGFGKGGY